MASPLPFPSLQVLKDLPLRVQLSQEVQTEIDRVLASPTTSGPVARQFFEDAMAATEKAIGYLDAEAARLTQERFAATDPNALRQRMIGEPRRLIDQTIALMKQKVQNDRQEWGRRLTKQARDVQATFEQEVTALRTEVVQGEHGSVVRPSEVWVRRYERWLSDTFAKWAHHQADLLRTKTAQLVRPELDTIEGLIDTKLEPVLPSTEPLVFVPQVDLKSVQARFEAPSTAEAIFETFKNGLNTVAMLAGLIVIPVIGSLMHESPMTMRAGVMGGMVVPIGVFAVWAGVRSRKKLVAVNSEKASEQVGKLVATDFKGQLERFRADMEKYCAQYGQVALSQVLSLVEPAIAHQMDKREKLVAQELANAQLNLDRINEQLMAIKQAKSGLTGQLVLDLKRKLAE